MKRNFTIPEFCEVYGPSRSGTYEMFAAGVIKPVKIGRRTFIPADEAERWLATLQSNASYGEAV
jgi:hypothetical protein